MSSDLVTFGGHSFRLSSVVSIGPVSWEANPDKYYFIVVLDKTVLDVCFYLLNYLEAATENEAPVTEFTKELANKERTRLYETWYNHIYLSSI